MWVTVFAYAIATTVTALVGWGIVGLAAQEQPDRLKLTRQFVPFVIAVAVLVMVFSAVMTVATGGA